MKCIEQCIHVDIDEELNNLALYEEEQMLRSKKDNPTDNNLNSRRDYIGSLAQNGVFRMFDNWGIYIERTAFYDKNLKKDLFDYRYSGMTVDVKGEPMGSFQDGTPIDAVFWKTSFLVSVAQEWKEMDYYNFCKVDLTHKVIHIAGVVPYRVVWGDTPVIPAKTPARRVLASQLQGLSKFVFRV